MVTVYYVCENPDNIRILQEGYKKLIRNYEFENYVRFIDGLIDRTRTFETKTQGSFESLEVIVSFHGVESQRPLLNSLLNKEVYNLEIRALKPFSIDAIQEKTNKENPDANIIKVEIEEGRTHITIGDIYYIVRHKSYGRGFIKKLKKSKSMIVVQETV